MSDLTDPDVDPDKDEPSIDLDEFETVVRKVLGDTDAKGDDD